ncbi:hypothetical protein WICMUC_004237 [Wickerhamomyces mucosus]|uniref:Protein phosphatase 1 regulatory subunit 7 n=1 Tax=Wickerhamomyces mucosus TaxID=1378264 RepID=A0A9P8PI27_9ASCO|nr:hypothetical protein WICMUC_004237 [Wickerhamomyces mucosus]
MPKEIHSASEYEDSETEEDNKSPQPTVLDTLTGVQSSVRHQIQDDFKPDKIDADEDLVKGLDPNSEHISLIHLKIQFLEDLHLNKFPKLKVLNLRQNLIEDIHEVKNISDDLEELDLYDNRIKHISSRLNLKIKLITLDLSFNLIKNIKNIENLINLKNLYFIENKISEITNISHFENLQVLELGGNRLKKIDNLPLNLRELWIGKNRISKLENISHLKNLKILSIQSNRLTKIENLPPGLTELYLSHNGISKLENLDELKNLEILDITSNPIKTLENVKQLKNLTDLWASYCKFDSFKDVEEQLKDNENLETVYLEGSPLHLQNVTSYRRKIILLLPQIEKLDATYVR